MGDDLAEPALSGSLAGVGLTDVQEEIYRCVVARPAISTGDIAHASAHDAEAVASTVDALVSLGLLDRVGETLVAVSPKLALAELVRMREMEARLARDALDQLVDQFRDVREGRGIGGIEVVRGRSNIADLVRHLLRSTRVQMRMFCKPPFSTVSISENDAEKELARRKLPERVIIERSVLDEDDAEQEVLISLDRGQDVRLVETLPSKLLIVDDTQAIVQLDEGGQSHDLVAAIGPGGLFTSLVALFEGTWERSITLREAPSGRFTQAQAPSPAVDLDDPIDRKLLALLLAGHTDAAVAARLGLGLRTVQRRIRHLMDLSGTESRIMLGWYARDRGWL